MATTWAANSPSISEGFDSWLMSRPERTEVRIPSGTHLTRGYWTSATAFKEGWNIRGEGMGNTILKLVEVRKGANTVLRADRKQRVSITDLTIDCNGRAFEDATTAGLEFFQCGFVTVERVEILNAVGKRKLAGTSPEAWGIWSDAKRTIIRDCVFRSFLGGSCTAFAKGGATLGNGEITGCLVDFDGSDWINGQFGLSAMITSSFTISGNTVINATRGYNHDTGGGRNLVIRDNHFLGYYWGLFVGGGVNGQVIGNLFEPARAGCTAIMFDSSPDVPGARDWLVRNNTFVNPQQLQNVWAFRNRNNTTVEGLFIEENRMDPGFERGGMGSDSAKRWNENRTLKTDRNVSEP